MELDDDDLALAADLLGTPTASETVNAALWRVVDLATGSEAGGTPDEVPEVGPGA
ncbi:hypothetical protein [Kitasatospora sp. NPDC056184]|uniref:hypothetical protein n=1 Tax=Kitasatospora sp. NPDC056184 TaxID=3345738 RepID=UPI0035D6004C